MKIFYTFLISIVALVANAQVPQGFNYQATVRNNAGALMTNASLQLKFSILKDTATGTIVYSESQTKTTDGLGQVSTVVGQGTALTGTFAAINWGTGTHFLAIELNTGNGFVAMGTTQLLSVPYALYANSAGSTQTPNLENVLAVNNNANNLQIKNLAAPTDTKDAVTAEVVQNSTLIYGAATGVANAYEVALTPAPTAYQAGMMLTFKANVANTGAATLNINGLGAKTIKKLVTTDVAANDITLGQMVIVMYDGTNFQYFNPATTTSGVLTPSDSNTLIYTTNGF